MRTRVCLVSWVSHFRRNGQSLILGYFFLGKEWLLLAQSMSLLGLAPFAWYRNFVVVIIFPNICCSRGDKNHKSNIIQVNPRFTISCVSLWRSQSRWKELWQVLHYLTIQQTYGYRGIENESSHLLHWRRPRTTWFLMGVGPTLNLLKIRKPIR